MKPPDRATIQLVEPTRGPIVPLTRDIKHWLGRAPDCSIVLDASSVSRHHVSVSITDRGILLMDDSANGTIVDHELLHKSVRLLRTSSLLVGVGPYLVQVRAPDQFEPDTSNEQSASPISSRILPASCAGLEPSPHARGDAPEVSGDASSSSPPPTDRRAIHRELLQQLDLGGLELRAMEPGALRPRVEAALRRILTPRMKRGEKLESMLVELADEALGLGPLERLLHDDSISEVMVVDPKTIFVEIAGKLKLTGLSFTDDDSVRAVIERIVTPLGRRIDESTPLVDARLKDGSRVNAVIPPLALRGPCITIRKFSKKPLQIQDLIENDSITIPMARFIERSVEARKNILISGGTGSGKTTLLNVMSAAIPSHERIVTVEDAAELRLNQTHVVSLEARPPNLEGKGEYTIRDLVKNALRMRPDRIIVGECRGGEALDMLQAMNTGHEGSLTTIHANSPREAMARLETLCLMSGLDLPAIAIRQQISRSIHLIVQQSRFSDGTRRVTSITEVGGIHDGGELELRELFAYKKLAVSKSGSVRGEFVVTGYLPSFLEDFLARGIPPHEVFG